MKYPRGYTTYYGYVGIATFTSLLLLYVRTASVYVHVHHTPHTSTGSDTTIRLHPTLQPQDSQLARRRTSRDSQYEAQPFKCDVHAYVIYIHLLLY